MVDLQKLTADNFTKETGIKVNFTVLPENDVRDKISQEFSSQAGQYDVATLSATSRSRSTPSNGWLAPLDDYIAKDPAFDQDDILKPMTAVPDRRGRQGLRRAVLRRVVVPDVPQGRPRREGPRRCPTNPTWQQVADIAAKVDGAQPGHEGHLPARPARLGPGLRPAHHRGEHLRRHLVRRRTGRRRSTPRSSPRPPSSTSTWSATHGEAGAAAGRLHRVPEQHDPGQRRHVVRRHLRGRLAGGRRLPGQGQDRLRRRRRWRRPSSSGWLYTWAWGIQKASKKQDDAWKFISWASSKEYEELVGQQLGWSKVPAGKRASTYENPDYLQGRAGVRRADQGTPSRAPTRTTRACSRGRRPASSSSASPSSPTWAPRSRRTSARRSPAR